MGPALRQFINLCGILIESYLCLLLVFVLGSIAIEIRMFNAIKKRTYFVSLAQLLPSRIQVRFFTLVLNKWWAKLVI